MWRRWVSMCDLCWTICICNGYVYDILIFNVIYIHKIVQGIIRCVKCVTRGRGNEYFDASVRWAQIGACTVVSYGFFMSLCTNVNYVYNAWMICVWFLWTSTVYIYNVSFDVCKGMVSGERGVSDMSDMTPVPSELYGESYAVVSSFDLLFVLWCVLHKLCI